MDERNIAFNNTLRWLKMGGINLAQYIVWNGCGFFVLFLEGIKHHVLSQIFGAITRQLQTKMSFTLDNEFSFTFSTSWCLSIKSMAGVLFGLLVRYFGCNSLFFASTSENTQTDFARFQLKIWICRKIIRFVKFHLNCIYLKLILLSYIYI